MESIEIILAWLQANSDSIQIGEPIQAWLGTAVGFLGSAIGALGSAKANRRNARQLKAMENENRQDYLREYYRGALDNEGARAYLKKLDERMKRNDQAAENALTAQGATHENALAVKQANNQTYSDAVSNLVEREEGHKSAARSEYNRGKDAIANAQMQQNANQAATWSQIGQGIASASQGVEKAGGWADPEKKLEGLYGNVKTKINNLFKK